MLRTDRLTNGGYNNVTDRQTNSVLYMLQKDRLTKNVLYMLQTDRLKEGYTSDDWKTILFFWANIGPLTLVKYI